MKIKNVAQFIAGGVFAASIVALGSVTFSDTVSFLTELIVYSAILACLIISIITFLLCEDKDYYMSYFYGVGVAIVNSILNKFFYRENAYFYDYFIEGRNNYYRIHTS